jgi:hypothetical protein
MKVTITNLNSKLKDSYFLLSSWHFSPTILVNLRFTPCSTEHFLKKLWCSNLTFCIITTKNRTNHCTQTPFQNSC